MKNRFSIFLLFVLVYADIHAQLSTNEKPVSFSFKSKPVETSRLLAKVVMPDLDMAKIEKEDKEDEEMDMPPRFGFTHFVDYDLKNSGVWYRLPNGDKLWQLNVICPGALSINFCYDKFWIPQGGKLFIYSTDKKQYIGAFTSKNNKGDRENLRGFATGLIYGSDVMLEYYQPKEVAEDAIISIDYVVHGYKYIPIEYKSYGNAGACMVNINCEEGEKWQNDKNAVAKILIDGHRLCSGSLLNSSDLSQKPYFLTADHCIGEYDAVTFPNLDYYTFFWNYEAPGCINDSIEPSYYSTSGATILANNSFSDFALLRLIEDPQYLSNYIPFYLGWDCTGLSGDPGVCIHHPRGDVKKISTVAYQPISTFYGINTENINANHWKVMWASTLNGHGTTEGGSSGSPLFTSEHKVIGQLHGGASNCEGGIWDPDWYGKFNVSWNGNNNDSIQRRLNCWLDSINSGVQTMEGLLVVPESRTMTMNDSLYCNIIIKSTGRLTIRGNIELKGNSSVIVEAGGKLIINGGPLSNGDIILKSGATLRIINGGIIETRNGFEAPIGALVEILNGQIL